jgi:hypothetical protein
MISIPFFQRYAYYGILIGLAVASGADAQVSSINSAVYNLREINDVPTSSFSYIGNYSTLIRFTDFGVSGPPAGIDNANRASWRFSSNGGATAYQFQNNDYFQVSMTLRLQGNPISPTKEAGFLLNTLAGDGKFIVKTDTHQVVAGGGPLPSYAFAATYDSGETITLGMHYFLDNITGLYSIQYSADGVLSPVLAFNPFFGGIGNNSTLGGYFQILNDSSNPFNSGIADFQNISIVPEPSTFAMVGLGILTLGFVVARRRRI